MPTRVNKPKIKSVSEFEDSRRASAPNPVPKKPMQQQPKQQSAYAQQPRKQTSQQSKSLKKQVYNPEQPINGVHDSTITQEMRDNLGDVPWKFHSRKKTFLQRLAKAPRFLGIHTFGAFPKDVSFASQDRGEDIILVARQSPIVFLPQYIAMFFILISPLIFFGTLSILNVGSQSSVALGISGAIVSFLVAVAIGFDTFSKWFYTVNIITSKRIVDVDMLDVMHHRFSETRLGNVEDVTHKVTGIFGSLFDFGTVFIQTAGARPEFEFQNVPRPRDIQDTLLDVLDLEHKGHI